MTEQELRTSITPCIMAGNTWFVFEQIKTYAEAETKELEEAYAELKSSYEKFYESDAVQHKQILALNAEIKRLCQGISLVHGLKGSMLQFDKTWGFKMLKYLLTGKERGGQCARLLEESLPPPVAESRHPIALQMYKCNNCQWRGQVGESIETETCDVCPECKSEDLLLYDEDEDQE